MLKFWELGPSPNNLKVRLALRFKGIEFEAIPVDPRERTNVLEATGQELTPAIADRDIVLNDSEAILQYLDANYRNTPRLFPPDKTGRRECESWHRVLDGRLARPWLPVFLYGIGSAETLDEEARGRFHDALTWLDEELGARDSFNESEEMAVCDLRVAEFAVYAFPGQGLIERVRLFRRFQEHYALETGSRPNLERFLERWNAWLA